MGRFHFKKYSYLILWAVLLLAIAFVWIFGGIQQAGQGKASLSPIPAPTLAPTASSGPTSSPSPSPSPVPAEHTLTLPESPSPEPREEQELVGVWVPYFSLSVPEHTREAFEANFREIADLAKSRGINALFVHVRPFSDSLYPSELFPWSHILTGSQGQNPGFDPLEFMVEYAHSQNMEFHAWLNPLRVKTSETPEALSSENPYSALGEEYPYYFMEHEGGVYLNPAYSYVRSLIAQGAGEIVENYEVDGIHFDDYFYPTQDGSIDIVAYEQYASSLEVGEPLSLLEWRQANVSAMVQEVYAAVKSANPRASFGISPQGNISNDEAMGADVKSWCAVEGYVDYICPQLYYSFDHPTLGYEEALGQWTALPAHDGLSMYVGLALYKAGSDGDGGTWELSSDMIARQIRRARESMCNGIVLYSSAYLDAEQTREEVENAMAELENN